MDIAALVVQVGLVTEFIKKAVNCVFKIDIHGAGAVILSILVSAGVVFVAAIKTDTAFTFALVTTFIQVAIYANAGFALLKSRGVTNV